MDQGRDPRDQDPRDRDRALLCFVVGQDRLVGRQVGVGHGQLVGQEGVGIGQHPIRLLYGIRWGLGWEVPLWFREYLLMIF